MNFVDALFVMEAIFNFMMYFSALVELLSQFISNEFILKKVT